MKTAVSDMLISGRGLKGDFTELYLLHLICASVLASPEKEKGFLFFFFYSFSPWLLS